MDEYRINISTVNNVALYEASVYGQIQVLKYILAHPDFDPNSGNMIFPAFNDDANVVKVILEDGRVDPSKEENDAIINAAENGNLKSFQLLIADLSVDPSDQNNQAIIRAAAGGNFEIFQLLFSDSRVDA